jgi:hypothetical protein
MANFKELREVFNSFCAFGSARNLATGSNSMLNGNPAMDNVKFKKLCKDCQIIDKNVTTTECDIIFSKYTGNAARTIDFDTFTMIFQELAQKKYPAKKPRDAYHQLLNFMQDKYPKFAPGVTKTETGGVYAYEPTAVFDRLTNVKGYTGTHKERFNSDGTGRGIDGRLQQTSYLTSDALGKNPNDHNITTGSHQSVFCSSVNQPPPESVKSVLKKRNQEAIASMESVYRNPKKDKHQASSAKGSSNSVNKGSTSNLKKSIEAVNANPHATRVVDAYAGNPKKGGIFDRLTNPNSYGGTHAHRFNPMTGAGNGISGRS